MATKVDIQEIKQLYSSFDDIATSFNDSLTKIATSTEVIQSNIVNFTELSVINADIHSLANNFKGRCRSAIELYTNFLKKQMRGYETSIEEALSMFKGVMTSAVTNLGIDMELSFASTSTDFYEVTSTASLQETINSLNAKKENLINGIETYQYILNDIETAWVSSGSDIQSIKYEMDTAIKQINGAIIPTIEGYVDSFNYLIAAINKLASEQVGEVK